MPTVAVIPLDTTRAVGNNNPLVSTYTYNVDAGSKIFGSVNTQTDTSGYVAKYFYDANNGNLLATVGGKTGDSTYDQGYAYTYDAVGRITNVYPASCSATATSATANTNSASAAYSYNAQSRLSSIVTATTTYNFTYDMFGKSLSVSAGDNILVSYTYKYIEDSDNNKVDVNGKLETETYANNFSVKYVYDTLDRVKESGIIKIQYTYDSLSQLIREDNAYADHSYTYEYDGNGNITTKKTYAYTTGTLGSVEDTITYSYGNSDWKDLMTRYDGNYISYDASGNPTYWWANEADITWTGRQLDSMEFPDGALWTYQYDYNGLRTERKKDYMDETLRYEYKWVDGKLAEERRYKDELTAYITLKFYYDGEELIGFNYNGDNYYYGKTNNGEIRFIYDSNGNIVTTYHYDAWGTPISTTGTLASTVGRINPFRYKSYYYDSETRLYYLQSRYYDPQVGRFLNADGLYYLGLTNTALSWNLFLYCENNPTLFSDTTGFAKEKTYSGIVGFGFQIMISISAIYQQYFAGLEAIWFTVANNFGYPRFAPWVYLFYGGGMGFILDIDAMLSKDFLSNPKKLLQGFGLGIGASVSITFFLVTAKNMKSTADYEREFTFRTFTAFGVTVSKASGSNISTYGVGVTYALGWKKGLFNVNQFSFGKLQFGSSEGFSWYIRLDYMKAIKDLYSYIKSRL